MPEPTEADLEVLKKLGLYNPAPPKQKKDEE